MVNARIHKVMLGVIAVSTAVFLGSSATARLVKHFTGQYPFPILKLYEIAYFVGLIASVIAVLLALFSFAGKSSPNVSRRAPFISLLVGLLFLLIFFIAPVVQSLYVRAHTPEPWMTEEMEERREPQPKPGP